MIAFLIIIEILKNSVTQKMEYSKLSHFLILKSFGVTEFF